MNIFDSRTKKYSMIRKELESYFNTCNYTYDKISQVNNISIDWYGYTDKISSIKVWVKIDGTDMIHPSLMKDLSRFCMVHKVLMTEFKLEPKFYKTVEMTMKFMKI